MRKMNLLKVAMMSSILFSAGLASGQGMAVNNTGTAADASAILDAQSTTQGMLVPRMNSTQRGLIGSPATGLLVYQTDGTAGFYFYNGTAWVSLSGGGGAPSGAAGGDLAGTYPNPTLATTGVTAGSYGSATQVPTYTVNSKGQITAASNTTITGVTPGGSAGGDLTGSYPFPNIATSIGAGNNIIAAMNVSSGGLNGTKLSSATVPVSSFSVTGTASSTTFLRGDNTWATPAGGGSGTVTSVSSGSLTPIFQTTVSNATSTPTINYSLNNAPIYSVLTNSTGAISTPVYGKVHPSALLNLGGSANSTTFYRGDGQWITPSTGGSFYFFGSAALASNIATAYSGITPGGVLQPPIYEFEVGVPMPAAMTIDGIYGTAYTRTGTGTATAYTGTLRVNGVNTSMQVSFNATGTANTAIAFTGDTSHPFSVSAGDIITIVWSCNGAGNNTAGCSWVVKAH